LPARSLHIIRVIVVRFGLLFLAHARAPSLVSVSPQRDPHCDVVVRSPFMNGTPIMAIGTVKWFNATKGYGFIQPEDGSKDVFLHISDVQRAGLQDPREGDKIEYEIQRGQQGKESAGNLKRV
jgi:CspA family cold shock protein